MSYSFDVKAPSKTAAILAAEERFAQEKVNQPVHAKDEAVAFANLRAHIALAGDPEADEQVVVSMHGSISVVNDRVVGCSSGCGVYISKV